MKKRSFTLIEVLISIISLVIVLLSVYYIYKSGRNFWSSEQSKLDVLRQVRTTFVKIERDLREAIIQPPNPENPIGYPLKYFSPTKISFDRFKRYGNLLTQEVTYEIVIVGEDAKIVKRTSDSLKEEVLLKTDLTEGPMPGQKVKYGLLAYNPEKSEEKTEFIGLDANFDPFKYDSLKLESEKQAYLQKHITYDRVKTTSIIISIVVKDIHGNINRFQTHVYPRSRSF